LPLNYGIWSNKSKKEFHILMQIHEKEFNNK
jgi:hypothetical protein